MRAVIIAMFLNMAFIFAQNLKELKFLENVGDESFKIKCFWLKDWNIFNLNPLTRPANQKWDFNITVPGGRIFYSFCENTFRSCKNNHTQMIAENVAGMCDIRAGEAIYSNDWKFLNSSNPYYGLHIQLKQGGTCKADSKLSYSVSFELACDLTGKDGVITIHNANEFVLGKCQNVIKASSREACPKANLYVIWQFVEENKWFFGIVLIAIGLFAAFFGVKLVYITIFVLGCLSTLTLAFLFLFQFVIPSGTNPNYVWFALVFSLVLGVLVGYIMYKVKKVFLAVIGGYLGYVVGITVYTAFLSYIHSNPQVVYWMTVLVCIILFAVLSFWLYRHILILSTSICGAYAVIRGISLYSKHFPSESIVIDLIQRGETDQLRELLNYDVYLYLAGWVILSIVGIFVQYKITKENENFQREIDENFISSK